MNNKQSDYANALKHRYRVETMGEFAPGVTTVLGIVEKPAFQWSASGIAAETAFDKIETFDETVALHRAWLLTGKPDRAKQILSQEGTDREVFIHYCRGEFKRQWNAKADRGNRIHAVAEAWARGESPEVAKEDNGYVDALDRFYRDYKPKFRHVECIMLNAKKGYGGRGDGVAELDGPNAEGVFFIDWKTTGDHYHYPVALQEAAYMECELAQYWPDGVLAPSLPLADLDGARAIYLREDGTVGVYDPFEIIDYEDAYSAFLTSLDLYNINKRINDQLKEAGEK